MALKGMESWDLITTAADITDYWQGESVSDIIEAAGRCGTSALYNEAATGNGAFIGVSTAVASGYAGWAYSTIDLGTSIVILEINNAAGDILMFVRAMTNGSLQIWKGPNTTLGTQLAATDAGFLQEDHYSHIGASWNFHASTGTAKIYVEGVEEATFTGDTTNIWTTGQWEMLYFRARGYIDDCYWGDTTGAAPWNAFLGDLHVEGQLALTDAAGGGGFYDDWAPSTGTDHGALVDDIPPDDNTTYLTGTVDGEQDLFVFPDIIPTTGTIYGVQLMPNMVKTEVGGRTFACLVRSDGTDATGTSQGVAITDYAYYPQIYQTNPVSSVAWTVTTVNDMQGGVEITL